MASLAMAGLAVLSGIVLFLVWIVARFNKRNYVVFLGSAFLGAVILGLGTLSNSLIISAMGATILILVTVYVSINK